MLKNSKMHPGDMEDVPINRSKCHAFLTEALCVLCGFCLQDRGLVSEARLEMMEDEAV